ncbi:UNVERIFIED_CONTAM: hypothetical protein FKN15_013245 [Acipenser sinensis]
MCLNSLSHSSARYSERVVDRVVDWFQPSAPGKRGGGEVEVTWKTEDRYR